MSRVHLDTRIIERDSDFIIRSKDGEELQLETIFLDSNQDITSVVTTDGTHITKDQLTFDKYVLPVPGVGNLTPGCRVVFKDKDYFLKFGWHTNISNQEIFSWHLVPLEGEGDVHPKTLYAEMIPLIESVHFR